MANSCNPQKSKVLTPALQKVEVLRQQLEAQKTGGDAFKSMNAFQKFMSGFVSLDNLATTWPQLRPYVNALKTGEEIRSRLNYQYADTMRKVADLDTKETRDITRIMEVEDAEGRLATENADGTSTITANGDHVGVKKGETVTLSKNLNETRREMRRVMDELFTHMIDSTKVAMGYRVDEVVVGKDALLLKKMEEIRKPGYIPHIRKGSWGITYNLDGKLHLRDFGWNPLKGYGGGARQQALNYIEELKKLGATEISQPFDMVERKELLKTFLPKLDSLTKMDLLFTAMLNPKKNGADTLQEVKDILQSLRQEAAIPMARLRKRENVPGWLTTDNYDTYLRSIFAPFVASTSDWVANKATEGLRREAMSSIKNDSKLLDIVNTQEDYLHSNEARTAQLKALAFFYTLWGNLSSAVVNFTQIPHASLPFLGSAGGTGNAALQLGKATKDIMRAFQFTGDKPFDVEKLSTKLSPAELEMLREGQKRGHFSAMLSRDQAPTQLASSQIKELYAAGKLIGRVVEVGSFAFTAVETMNRMATALAAFRMAQDKTTMGTLSKFGKNVGVEVTNPMQAAFFASDSTQGTMSKAFRARYMHGMAAGVLTQFSAFPIFMLGLFNKAARYYGGNLYNSAEARKMMALLNLGILSTSGIWGLPFVSTGADAWDWLTRKFGAELGLSPTALKAQARESLKDLFKAVPALSFAGSPAELADMVLNGPFRATGIDISKRTALDIIQFNPLQMDWTNFGPLGGAVGGGIRDFIAYKNKGEDTMAYASLMPLMVRNIVKSQVMQESGYITPGRMEPALPAKEMRETADVAKVATGFTPTKVAQAREALQETKELGTRMDDIRKSYSDKIATALNKSLNALDAEARVKYRKEAQEYYKEIAAYDKGKAPRDRILVDASAFNTSVQDKLKKMQQPQRVEAVPKVVRGEYAERLRD